MHLGKPSPFKQAPEAGGCTTGDGGDRGDMGNNRGHRGKGGHRADWFAIFKT